MVFDARLGGNPYLKGKMIEPLKIEGNEKVSDFISNVFGNSGYNARRLAEACEIYSRMIKEDATICLTLAGAMTPIGMGGVITGLIKKGFIDFIITTGANIYHDMHRCFNYPVVQGDFNVDDEDLLKHGVARIYDVFIDDSDTMLSTDTVIVRAVEEYDWSKPVSTAKFHKFLGDIVLKKAPHPEKSFLAVAAEHNVPVYTSSPGDSSIGMNILFPYLFGEKITLDPILDVFETTSIVRAAKKNGVIIIGGGSPKNFYLQTQPTLWQILLDSRGGHDYFVQLTTDSPQWGGLSGATPQEAKSWGKVKNAKKSNAVVYSCASITFPLLAQYASMNEKPRQHKELYTKLPQLKEELFKAVLSNNELKKRVMMETKPETYNLIYEKFFGQQTTPYSPAAAGDKPPNMQRNINNEDKKQG